MQNNIAIKILIGSQNYNLADENSDFDFKKFIVPTYEDIYYNRNLNKEVSDEKGNVFYKSLKDLPYILVDKCSWSNIELLLSRERLWFGQTESLIEYIDDNLNNIIIANPIKLWYSTLGEVKQRLNYIEKGTYTAGTKHLFDKYGYDTKQAMHTFRLLNLMRDFIHQYPKISTDILYCDDYTRDLFLDVKYGRLNKEECLINIRKKESELLLFKDDFLRGKEVQHTITHELNNIIKDIIKNWNF